MIVIYQYYLNERIKNCYVCEIASEFKLLDCESVSVRWMGCAPFSSQHWMDKSSIPLDSPENVIFGIGWEGR